MTMTDTSAVDNGVNVEALLGAREALTEAREAAAFTWRVRNEWIRGTHSRTTIEDFSGLGGEQTHTKSFTYDADHPTQFAAQDNAPTPVEFVLHALAGCLTGGIAAVAQNRGIQLSSVASTIEGDMDLAGILGIDRDVRNGFSSIRVTFDIDGDAGPEDLRAVVAQSVRRSAVYDIVTNNVDVVVDVA